MDLFGAACPATPIPYLECRVDELADLTLSYK